MRDCKHFLGHEEVWRGMDW